MTPEDRLASAGDRLFVALDTPDLAAAQSLIRRLDGIVRSYKIGLELMMGGGLTLAEQLKRDGRTVFLDMKLLDIPNTVEKATANIARLELDYLTVHGVDRKTLDAAVKGRGGSPLRLLAVTVLTSLDARDLAEQGIGAIAPSELVVKRALMAKAAGFDGVIASGEEAAAVRAAVGPKFEIVTPGIRPQGEAVGDQARIATPARAIAAGATRLVVGRPITAAPDPRAAARAILAEIATAAH